ncbi:helix-turn-helix domain-containing protein [Orrella marina]|uniref:XRE family transcriptional regulator n=1 Tax=Orrella marina TaxID=2163011 RepID=A0A2R4XG31_9BURK|nr:helix-turn-helix transcriptional regulator [Orrella marina]AWB32776.1 XRE family transcriptional regulator [Orrella marina]
MAKKQKYRKPDQRLAANPLTGAETMSLTTLKDLRKRAGQTQEELAASLGVGQDTISRLEKRSDMLLSTLRHYVECIGGKLDLVATFPGQPAMIIDYRDVKHHEPRKRGPKPTPAGAETL